MCPRPLTTKSLAQLHASISVDAHSALETVRRIIQPVPFVAPELVGLERDLREITNAVEEAERRDRQIAALLAGPWLCGDGGER